MKDYEDEAFDDLEKSLQRKVATGVTDGSKKDAALRLALDALEEGDWYINQLEMIVYSADDNGIHESREKIQTAIKAIDEALEDK
jgi:hypothetical protein